MNASYYSGLKGNINHRNNRFHNRKHSDPDLFRSFNSSSKHNSQSSAIGQFILGKTIGKGTFGKVKLGTHIITGEKAAIKILEKAKLLEETDKLRISREIKILKSTFHQNIIRLYSVIETKKEIYLITEYAEGGELFNYIVLKRKLNEFEACKFFHQLIDAVDYIHKLGICHRDLKPENMLLDYKRNLKIADFGLSNLYSKGELLSTACGSPGYAAPEMIIGEKYNGLLTDIWACGIILFAMLGGYLPFDDNDEEALYKKIVIGKYIMPNKLSSIAKDIISKILVTDPRQRMTIDQIRSHAWYHVYDMERVNGLFICIQPIPIDDNIIKDMKIYGYNEEEVKDMLICNKHNNGTTLYYMLVKKNTKRGISSISDLISDQFRQYIQLYDLVDPEYLIFTRDSSSLNIENTACTASKSISQKSKNIFCHEQNDDDSINHYSNSNNDNSNNFIINNELVNNGIIVYNDSIGSSHKARNLYLENIIEQNEKIETFGNIEPRITRFKGLKKLKHFKHIQNEIPLMTQLRSQYDKYMTNSQVKKQQTHFIKSFLHTSMSFNMIEHSNNNKNNNNHHTCSIDNNISTTPSNNNSKAPTPKNRNVYLKKKLNIFTNVNKGKGKGRRCFSQPKKDNNKNKQHLSSNAKSTENSTNRQNSNKNQIFFPTKRNQPILNSVQNKYILNKKYRAIHCKTPTFNSVNLSKMKYNINHRNVKSNEYKNNNAIYYRNKSMEDKLSNRNVFYSLKSKSNNKKLIVANCNNNKNKITSVRKISQNKKMPHQCKLNYQRPISEPKKAAFSYRNKYFSNNKQKNAITTHKRVHSRTIDFVLAQKKCKTIINQSHPKANNNNNSKYYHKHIRFPKQKPSPITKNKSISTEKHLNNHLHNSQKKQVFNHAGQGKSPIINLSIIKSKLLNEHNPLLYSTKKHNNHYHHSISTCSTTNKQPQIINMSFNIAQAWIFPMSIKQAKDIIQALLSTEQINATPIINTNNKYLCEKDSVSFIIKLSKSNEGRKGKENGITVALSKIKGDEKKYFCMKKAIHHIFQRGLG